MALFFYIKIANLASKPNQPPPSKEAWFFSPLISSLQSPVSNLQFSNPLILQPP